MSENPKSTSVIETMTATTAFRRAIRERSPWLTLLFALIAGFLTFLVVTGPLSSINELLDSERGRTGLSLAILVGVIVSLAVYCVRFWDEITNKTPFIEQIQRLESERVLLSEQLATTKAYNNDLSKLQAVSRDAFKGSVYDQIEAGLQRIAAEVEHAQHFKSNPALIASGLTTTHAQMHGNHLTVQLPIGRNQGAIEGLRYFLDQPNDDPNLFPIPLGVAILQLIEDERSLGVVYPASTDDAIEFWNRARINCSGPSRGYGIQLKATPMIEPSFQACSLETLSAIQKILPEITRGVAQALTTFADENARSGQRVNGG